MNANIGKLNSGKCYVYLNGYKAEPFWGTEAECETAILQHGVAEPIPVFCNGVDLTTSTKPAVVLAVMKAPRVRAKRRGARTYTVTFTVVGECYPATDRECSEDLIAVTHDDAKKQAREIWRHAQGPWGLKCKISARLAK